MALSAVLDKVLTKIDALSPTSGTMTSPVDNALSTKRDQIIDALNRGFAPGTIARMLAHADAPFAQESLRLGIVRIRDSVKASSRSESRRRRDSVPVADAIPDAISSRPKRDVVAENDAVASRRPSDVSSIAHLNSDV